MMRQNRTKSSLLPTTTNKGTKTEKELLLKEAVDDLSQLSNVLQSIDNLYAMYRHSLQILL